MCSVSVTAHQGVEEVFERRGVEFEDELRQTLVGAPRTAQFSVSQSAITALQKLI
ncbi:MAG: hypothetical protein U5J64_05960 [Halobacteriales archaeon]|nr:hypothetical protein [Halobacteriales archaeon]